MPREGGASSTPRLLGSITDVSGILGARSSRATTTERIVRPLRVIASEAKQSIFAARRKNGLLRCFTPRNDALTTRAFAPRGAMRPSRGG